MDRLDNVKHSVIEHLDVFINEGKERVSELERTKRLYEEGRITHSDLASQLANFMVYVAYCDVHVTEMMTACKYIGDR